MSQDPENWKDFDWGREYYSQRDAYVNERTKTEQESCLATVDNDGAYWSSFETLREAEKRHANDFIQNHWKRST